MPFPARPLVLLACTVLAIATLALYPCPKTQQRSCTYPDGLDTGP